LPAPGSSSWWRTGIGQVRDVLRKAGAHDEPPIYPTIDAALAALAPGAGGFHA
jgi:hypothetical protein